MALELISTELAARPLGHYSQAVVANGMVYVSGQLPIVPGSGSRMPSSIAEQATQALDNLRRILEAAGSAVECIVSVQIFVSDVALWTQVNEVYEAFMGAHKPARSVIPTRELHLGALIEINAVAAVCTGAGPRA